MGCGAVVSHLQHILLHQKRYAHQEAIPFLFTVPAGLAVNKNIYFCMSSCNEMVKECRHRGIFCYQVIIIDIVINALIVRHIQNLLYLITFTNPYSLDCGLLLSQNHC